MKTDEEIRNGIREALVYCRHEKGLTQEEVADLVEKKPTTIASWEQGLSLPNVQTLYRLAEYYKKSLAFMYGEEEEECEL